MPTREQYIQALSHPDYLLRSSVISILCEEIDPGIDITVAAIHAVETFGWDQAFEWTHRITKFSLDQQCSYWALLQCEALKERNYSLCYNLLSWINEKAPVSFLREMLPKIESLEQQIEEFNTRLRSSKKARRRLKYSRMSPDKCFELLLATGEVVDFEDDFPQDEIEEMEAICLRLLHDGEYRPKLAQCAQEWLRFDFTGDTSSSHLFSGIAIFLSGHLRLEPLIPRLLEHFEYEWDWWSESIQTALKRMRSPEALEVCAALYPKLPWHGRLYMTEVFATGCVPEIENALVQLTNREHEEDLRVQLGYALAVLGTPTAQSLAREIYNEDPSDPERLEIVEVLYPQYSILGIDEPEMPRWRAKMEAMQAKTKRLSSFNPAGLAFPAATPSATSKPALGRNDLCSCGSGKKYKKCCIDKS